MSNTKKNVIFNLNNILLSALGSENKFSKSLIAENNKYIKYVDENLKKEFKHILKGSKITYKPSDAPNETLALVSLPTNPAISF